ncbi:MAG: hypothetical protein P1P63_08710 [Treponemataceae bacterium]
MKKNLSFMKKNFFAFAFLCWWGTALTAQVSSVKTVNRTAAVNCLTKATEEVSAENWANAVFYANLGLAYDGTIADFPYVLALCSEKLEKSLNEQLSFAEEACNLDMSWRFYNRSDALLLCAKLYAQTGRYREALSIAESFSEQSADIDYVKLLCYYGLSQKKNAQSLLLQALDTWAFDFRFAKVFLQQENSSARTKINIAIAQKIIARSYVWESSNPEVLVLLTPFEKDRTETVRRLKVYREMYAPFTQSYTPEDLYLRSYALLLSLNFGIIDEKTAVDEFFNMTAIFFNPLTQVKTRAKGFYAKHLEELCRLVKGKNIRKIIADTIVSYNDCVFENGDDSLLNAVIFYENGRPSYAVFDNNQDGIADMTITCNFGIPTEIAMPATNTVVTYDEYPNVNRAMFENEQYILRPLDLRFKPVHLQALKLNLFDLTSAYSNMYVLTENAGQAPLNKRMLLRAAAYIEIPAENGGIERILLSNGKAISSQSLIGETVVATGNYKNGIIAKRELDRDCDGYFETLETYDKTGRLLTVSVDINKNKIYEYSEKHDANTIEKIWDENEDGNWEVLFLQIGDVSMVKWIHPINGEIVQVDFVKGIPKRIDYLGVKTDVYADAKNNFYWVGSRVDNAELNARIEKEITKYFNQSPVEVVSYSVTINEYNIFAVKSGGVIFAQIIETAD